MLIRISLVVAIIAGLAVGVLNFVTVKEKVTTLKTNLKTETEAHQKFEGDFNRTRAALDKTNAILKETQTSLAATQEERDKAVAEATAQTTRADKLNEDLTRTRGERDTAQTELASYKTSGMSSEQVAAASKLIKSLQDTLVGQQEENKLLGRKIVQLNTKLKVYETPDVAVELPATLKGKVLVSDPKWNFVVLNVGGDQGALEAGELLVNRNGRLVGKVKITSVQKDRSVANVVPGWLLGEILEGDLVVPAHPASS
jgi:hypothetical protein